MSSACFVVDCLIIQHANLKIMFEIHEQSMLVCFMKLSAMFVFEQCCQSNNTIKSLTPKEGAL